MVWGGNGGGGTVIHTIALSLKTSVMHLQYEYWLLFGFLLSIEDYEN